MDGDREFDAALSVFDPAFTFSDLLAEEDEKPLPDSGLTPVNGAYPSDNLLSDNFGYLARGSGESDQSQLQQEIPHRSAKCPDIPSYKQRARATQARFRLRQKVNGQIPMNVSFSFITSVQCWHWLTGLSK